MKNAFRTVRRIARDTSALREIVDERRKRKLKRKTREKIKNKKKTKRKRSNEIKWNVREKHDY